eukprot:TRINITY_DN493_c0_g1_i16.p2 TRINITY_DN493_c0_g1~~TRINITY_DN493_c0_g1_i16.p2  ORF type:complete len:177 (+),score=58.28 TRINITY_DN493_c0_g1_i16:425-955(+)
MGNCAANAKSEAPPAHAVRPVMRERVTPQNQGACVAGGSKGSNNSNNSSGTSDATQGAKAAAGNPKGKLSLDNTTDTSGSNCATLSRNGSQDTDNKVRKASGSSDAQTAFSLAEHSYQRHSLLEQIAEEELERGYLSSGTEGEDQLSARRDQFRRKKLMRTPKAQDRPKPRNIIQL